MDPFQQYGAQLSTRTQGQIIQKKQILISESNQQNSMSTQQKLQTKQLLTQKQQLPTGWTRFIKLNYYKQYFQISQQQVQQRIMYTIKLPYQKSFIQKIQQKTDFYGPFWILTTIVLLLGFVQNFSNYILSKFITNQNLSKYFFALQHIRQAITLMYSFGLGVPCALYFIIQFAFNTQNQQKNKEIPLPNLICLYGYSVFCFIPALICCILPLSFLQWILLLAALGNSSIVLIVNLLNYVQESKQKIVILSIIGMQFLLFLCIKLIFLQIYNN